MQRSKMRSTNNLPSKQEQEEELLLDEKDKYTKSGHSVGLSWSDRISIVVLLVLYTLQGIPMGLCGSIPMILKDKGVSYEALSLFSLVSLPFSMKIIWAPLVDSYYFSSIGRRKTWLIPVQLLTGLMMILGASRIPVWLHETDNGEPDTTTLTGFFFFLYLLMATQDIAVDGWALTMLSRENVGLASACNAFGQSLGVFLANQGLIALSDMDWCIKHFGTDGAIVTLPSFMVFWGYVFIVTTIVVCLFKSEEIIPSSSKLDSCNGSDTCDIYQAEKDAYQRQFPDHSHSNNSNDPNNTTINMANVLPIGDESELPGLRETIRQVMLLCQLPAIQSFLLVLFTARVGVAMVDGAFTFKLQEYGMRKTTLATMSPLIVTVSFLLPVVAGHSVSRAPLYWMHRGLMLRLVLSVCLWCLLQYTHYVYNTNNNNNNVSDTPLYYLTMVLLTCNEAASALVFLSQMSFFNMVSDPSIGGSYMTLLNTAANLGSKWPSVLCLYLLPKLTFASCIKLDVSSTALGEEQGGDGGVSWSLLGMCRSLQDHVCVSQGGLCRMTLDGYTVLTFAGVVCGVSWLLWQKAKLPRLQALPHSEWLVATAERHLLKTPPHTNNNTNNTNNNINKNNYGETQQGVAEVLCDVPVASESGKQGKSL